MVSLRRWILSSLLAALVVAGPARADSGLLVGFSAEAFRHEPRVAARLARELGATAFRITVSWQAGETRLGAGKIAELDDVVAAAGDMRIVVAVVGNAQEAPVDEDGRSQFCSFARSLVQRYSGIDDVVIWNEPNLSFFWKPQFNPDGTSAAPAAYEALLARCWDVLHAARTKINVIAPATAPRGNDKYDAVSNVSHSPGAFIRRMGDAYRESGRTEPLFDTVGHHAYGNEAAERPWRRHRGSTISEGDWTKLQRALSDGFAGTAQPIPGQCQGERCVSIWYLEAGYQTVADADKSGFYSGDETDPHPVPDLAPDSIEPYPPPEGSSAPDQATQIVDGVRLAFCQPYVEAFFNFQLWDDSQLRGWQSAPLWADRTRKDSFSAFQQVFADAKAGTIDCAPPAAPAAVTAVAGDGQVTLEWDDNLEPDLAGYRVYRRNPDGTWPTVATAETTASSFVDSGLENDLAQVYRLSAFDRAGNESTASAEVTATPVDRSAPAAPAAVTAVAGDGQVTLEWDDNLEPDLAGYRVYRRNPDGTWPTVATAETTASSFVDSGLENDLAQVYRLSAFDRAGNESTASAEVTATPVDRSAPAAPAAVTAVAGDGQVTLEWDDNLEPDLAGYRVYRRNPDGTWPTVATAETTASSFVDSGLENDLAQVYRLSAFDRAGNESTASAEVTATPARTETNDAGISASRRLAQRR